MKRSLRPIAILAHTLVPAGLAAHVAVACGSGPIPTLAPGQDFLRPYPTRSASRRHWGASALLAVTLGALGAWSVVQAPAARAQTPVTDAGDIAVNTANGVILADIDKNLLLLDTYLGGIYPPIPIPTSGIIQIAASMDARLAGVNAGLGQIVANQDAVARLREQDKLDINTVKARTPSYARTNCYDVTMGVSRALAAGGAADIRRQIVSHVQSERNLYIPDADRMGLVDRANEHSIFCSQSDINNKHPGCERGSISQYPDADLLSNSLTRQPSRQAGGFDPASNYSLDTMGQQAAQFYIEKVVPQVMPQPDPSQNMTENNKIYLAHHNRYLARSSVISDALSSISAAYTQSNATNQYGESSQMWNSQKVRDNYNLLFPNQTFPTNPSEMEMLRYDVFDAYADPTTIANRGVMTEKELAQEGVRMQALNARLLLMLIERTESLVKLQAVNVAQSMDPLTRAGLSGRLTSATSSN